MCLSRWSGEVQTNVRDPANCSSSSRSLGAIHCEPIGSTGCRLIIFILRLSRRASHDWSDGSVSASYTQSGTGSASAALRQAIAFSLKSFGRMQSVRRGVMRKRVSLGCILVAGLAFLLCGSTASGQAVYGGIVGSVTDPQGNAVAGAKVTVTNISRGTTEEAVTNESGGYSVTHLIPDNYKVHIEAPGFKAYDVASARVDVDTVVRVDAQLQVGAVTQTVEVTGEIPQLQTEKTDVATIFESRTVEDLPTYNRNFTTLQLLSPGAQRLNWGHAASENPQGSQQIETNGQHFAGTAFELDGTDNQDPILGIIVVNPNLDAIEETKIIHQDYDAEFGKAIGAIVTTQTKSGTNEIHGSGFEFERSNSKFAGNVIPANRLSAQAAALLSKIPLPNTTRATPFLDNFFASGNNTLDSNGFDVRSDFVATNKVNVFGRYSFQQFKRSGPGLFGVNIGGHALPSDPSVGDFAGDSSVRNQSIATGFDYTLSPTLLTDVRFGYMRYRVNVSPGGFGTTPAKDAGIPNVNTDSTTSAMPAFTIQQPGGASEFLFGYSLHVNQCNCPLTEQEHQYQFVNNWTNIRGKHAIKFGADVRYAYNLRVPSDSHRAGQFDFNNDAAQGAIGGTPDGGAGLAGFLLGLPSHFERYVSNSLNAYETQPRLFFYGQDTIHWTSKLTVNLGLRWEIYRPESAARTAGGGWVDLQTGEMRVAGQNGVDLRGNTSTSFKHFAPRVGIAYQANSKNVVRLGNGRSYEVGVFGSLFVHAITQNLPVLGAQQLNSNTGGFVFNLAQGPPTFDPATKLGGTLATSNCNAITDPSGVVGGVFTPDKAQCLGVNGRPLVPDGVFSRARPFNNRLPTVDQWNATVQRQVTSTISATLAYVGNKGTHQFAGGGPAYGANDPTVVGFAAGVPKNNRRPFYNNYGWTQNIDYFGSDADNHYNSLQATVEKRFSGGLSFQGSYTFQHSTNYDGSYYNIDRRVAYGPNDDYRDHLFIFTQVYDLPFGHGKRWASNLGRAADLLIGGWSINSATVIGSGLPFTPHPDSCSTSSDTGPCRADVVGSVKNGPRSGNPETAGYWFETTGGVKLDSPGKTVGPWAQPAVETFGNVGRNTFRGPKFWNTDFSVFKTF